jgi:hypothetical protein
MKPSPAWREKFVRAAALNAAAAELNAPFRTQQRLYDRLVKLQIEAATKWPWIDFETGLTEAVRKYRNEHPIVGPGKDW